MHKHLGCGFLEAVYKEALLIEYLGRDIPFEQEKILDIYYKGRLLKKKFVADFICYSNVIIELKALGSLTSDHDAQVLNYLKATGIKLGILVNFGETSLKYKRLVL